MHKVKDARGGGYFDFVAYFVRGAELAGAPGGHKNNVHSLRAESYGLVIDDGEKSVPTVIVRKRVFPVVGIFTESPKLRKFLVGNFGVKLRRNIEPVAVALEGDVSHRKFFAAVHGEAHVVVGAVHKRRRYGVKKHLAGVVRVHIAIKLIGQIVKINYRHIFMGTDRELKTIVRYGAVQSAYGEPCELTEGGADALDPVLESLVFAGIGLIDENYRNAVSPLHLGRIVRFNIFKRIVVEHLVTIEPRGVGARPVRA